MKRNRARRRVREALRVTLGARPAGGRGMDILVMVRPAALAAPTAELRGALQRELDRVLR